MKDSLLKTGLWQRKNQFRKSCENKEQFFTKKDCDSKIKLISVKTNEKGLVSYKCPFCDWWHYGHEIGLERKNKEVTE